MPNGTLSVKSHIFIGGNFKIYFMMLYETMAADTESEKRMCAFKIREAYPL